MEKFDVIIVGAGPGGLTAALYTSRANLSTLIIDGGLPGGQLNNTSEIENYPGFRHVSGPYLATEMFGHAQAFGAKYKWGLVRSVMVLGDNTFRVNIGMESYFSKSVIVATGTTYRKLGVPGEEEFEGRGVSWCAVCDGAFFKDKHVVVVGGGDSAVEEAMYLTKFASKVTILHRRDKFRAQPILVDRMMKNSKVDIKFNAVVDEILGEGKVTGVKITEHWFDKATSMLECDGVFEYIGMDPTSSFVKPLGVTDEEGWIVTDEKMRTKIPGLFAVGDVRKDATRQVVVATGEGCIAGIEARHYLDNL